MSSRAASAASSRRVKQELVRLLFGSESSALASLKTVPNSEVAMCRSKKLDYSSYSYMDLRTAYLERLQNLHPDKKYSEKDTDPHNHSTRHHQFVELQEAWNRYEKMAKLAKNVDTEGRQDKEKNFTMFGVGCSFSDNEWERDLRTEITDQACRGWFSSGSLVAAVADKTSEANTKDNAPSTHSRSHVSILDENDDMFIPVDETPRGNKLEGTDSPPRKSLVDARFRPRSSGG